MRRGIILAGGRGQRLHPATIATSKQLLPIYDKPMIYYPLSTLMLANIQDILIISTLEDSHRFRRLFGDGKQWGLRFQYAIQENPDGLAQALIIGESFLDGNPSALILGDYLFFGANIGVLLAQADSHKTGATVFAHPVQDATQYGVVTFDKNYRATHLEEKPKIPKSNYAVAGLYFYDTQAPEIAKQLTPSNRGELEITDLNKAYLEQGQLNVIRLGRGFAWLDTGTHDSLLQSGKFIEILENRQGQKIGCPEEIAWRNGWIDTTQLLSLAKDLEKTDYGTYLHSLAEESEPEILLSLSGTSIK